jgi:membrane-bound lytic murein transglycosylase F
MTRALRVARSVALLLSLGTAAALWAQDTAPAPRASATVRRQTARTDGRYDDTFRRYAKRYFGVGFDWRYFKAQGMAESGLDPNARSFVGARGVMQLMPSTFHEISTKRPEFASIDDPEWNIAAGIMHDRYLWKLWSATIAEPERPAFMFASYNAGEGTIARALGAARANNTAGDAWSHVEAVAPRVPRWRYRETLGYVRKIDGYYTRLKAPR